MARKRKCACCKGYFDKETMKTANNVLMFCGIDCMSNYAYKNKEKGKIIKHNIEKKELRDNDRKIRMPAAQKAFNAFIRERDKDLPCISCGKFIPVSLSTGGQYDCGHFKTVGGFPELRFVEINAHKQCKKCNGGAGNFSKKDTSVAKEYRKNLIDKIGLDRVEWIEGPHEPKKYTCEDLKVIEVKYKVKLKELTG